MEISIPYTNCFLTPFGAYFQASVSRWTPRSVLQTLESPTEHSLVPRRRGPCFLSGLLSGATSLSLGWPTFTSSEE